MRYLLDANVLSEAVRPRPDSGVANWLVQHEGGAAISELTIGEFTKGAFFLPAGPKRKRILAWIADVEAAFDLDVREVRAPTTLGVETKLSLQLRPVQAAPVERELRFEAR